MALTRRMLKAMGIEDEKIDQIIEEHISVTDELKKQRDGYKEDADKLIGVQTKLNAYEKDGADGKETVSKEDYDALKTEYDNYKADITAKETKAAKERAYRELLTAAGVSEKRIDSIMKVSDVDSIEIGEDGKIKDAEAYTERIKSEWSDFITTTETRGIKTANPPAKSGVQSMSKEEIMSIKDATERRAAIAQNMALFNNTKE